MLPLTLLRDASLPWSGDSHRQEELGDAGRHVDPFAEAASPASDSALLSGSGCAGFESLRQACHRVFAFKFIQVRFRLPQA